MVTQYKIRVDGSTGKAAIFTVDSATPSDDAPLTSPASYPDRLRMHTDNQHVAVVDVQSGSKSITGHSAGQNKFTLFAHGRSVTPCVAGYCTFNDPFTGAAVSRPMVGSVQLNANANRWGWITLGADATNVFVNVYVAEGLGATSYAAFTLNYTVWVFDIGFNGSGAFVPAGSGSPLFQITSDYMIASGGNFDTRRRYMYEDATGPIYLPLGRTIDVWYTVSQRTSGGRIFYNICLPSPTFTAPVSSLVWCYLLSAGETPPGSGSVVDSSDITPVSFVRLSV